MWRLQKPWQTSAPSMQGAQAAMPTPDCAEDRPQHLGPCPFRKVPGVLAPHGLQTAPQSCLCWLSSQSPWPRLDSERSRSSPDYRLIST